MSALNSYIGSIELSSGLVPKNGKDFPLIDAHYVQVGELGTRMDEFIASGGFGSGNSQAPKLGVDDKTLKITYETVDGTVQSTKLDVENKVLKLTFDVISTTPDSSFTKAVIMSQEDSTGFGDMMVSDLVSYDTTIQGAGFVKGTFYYIRKWEDFSENTYEQSGFFLPIRLSSEYSGKEIKVTCVGDAPYEISENKLDWVLRITGSNAGRQVAFKFEADGEVLFTLNLQRAIFEAVPSADYSPELIATIPLQAFSLGLGDKTVGDLCIAGASISKYGTVTGSLHKVRLWEEFSNNPGEQSGYYLPVLLDSWYASEPVSCTCILGGTPKKVEDRLWVLKVVDKDEVFTFSLNGQKLIKINFDRAVFE